jgi:hypothetical protein
MGRHRAPSAKGKGFGPQGDMRLQAAQILTATDWRTGMPEKPKVDICD